MNIDAARAVPIEDVAHAYGLKLRRQSPELVGPCPRCGGTDRFAISTKKQVFNCRGCRARGDTIDLARHITGCSVAEAVAALTGTAAPKIDPRPSPSPPSPAAPKDDERVKRLKAARWLWRKHRPLLGSVGERYIRARGYTGLLPATLGFLPATAEHPDPAVIAAFGMPREVEPGVLALADDAAVGVHLIKLLPDGSNRRRDIEDAKIIVGIDFVAPIVLAPPNDLLALTIGEGIEKVLADHEVSGAGAWAATTANRLPGLAALVPNWVECVTVLVDDNKAGRENSAELAAKLDSRGFEVLLTPTGTAS